MLLDYIMKWFISLNHKILIIFNLLIVLVLAVGYATAGITLCFLSFILEFINSIEDPVFAVFRQFVKRCINLMFRERTYRRFGYNEEAIRRGDSYIDKLLEDMFENSDEEYDPYVLEDSVVGFSKKVMFVNVTGEAKLHDGSIKGLSTLHRAKHCALLDEGNKLRVKADLGAGELDFNYKGSVKFMNFGPTITVHGTLSYIEVHMEFKVNSKTGKDGRLTKFVIDDMRDIKVRISGLGPLNWAINPILSGVTRIFKKFVRNFMEHKVEKHIREHIPNYQFPVEEGENTEIPEVSTLTEQPEETTTEPETETPEPETDAPEETPEPETDAPEETPEPETDAPEETPEPETEAPEETPEPQPETEAPEETPEPEPETEAPEETPEPEPETEAPEPETEAPEPETEAPEPETEAPEPETEAPETEAPEPETEAPEPETEAPENPDAIEEISLPETPDTSITDELDETISDLDEQKF